MRTVGVAILGLFLIGAGPEKEALKCPISGKDAKDDIFLDVNGKKVHFCCDKCPTAYAKKIGLVDKGPEKCALGDGQSAKADTKFIRSTAEMVYFCCEKCPGKYAEKEKLTVADKGAKTCAACSEKASADHSLVVNGEKLYFCCEKCEGKFLKAEHVVDKGADKCVISGHPAKKETGQVRIKYEAVYFCCGNCRGKYVEKAQKEDEKAGKKFD